MRILKVDLENIHKDICLRADEKYYSWLLSSESKIFKKSDTAKQSEIKLKEILYEDAHNFSCDEDIIYKGLPTGFQYFDEDGDIIDYLPVNNGNKPDRLKYKVELEQLVVSSLKGAKTPAILIDESKTDYIYSNGFYIFSVKAKNFLPEFVYYILRHNKTKNIFDEHIFRGIGIQSFYSRDVLNLKIPFVPLSKQQKILSEIRPLEQKIKSLKTSIQIPKNIVDTILSQKFRYSLDIFEERSTQNKFNIQSTALIKSSLLRSSTKFHHPKYEYLAEVLKEHKTVSLKQILSAPTVLGKSPEYDTEGEAFYLSPDVIKTWSVNFDEAQNLSEDFYHTYKKKYSPKNGDIIMIRASTSSSSIGKTALYEYDEKVYPSIFSDFTMRLRPDVEKVIPKYLYYYTMSFLFRTLIDLEKQGLDIMNIYPSQVENFPIVLSSITEQKQILEEIESKISEQKKYEKTITQLRFEIDKIIEKGITKN